MTIEKFKADKEKLNEDISKLINDFIDKYQCKDINLDAINITDGVGGDIKRVTMRSDVIF